MAEEKARSLGWDDIINDGEKYPERVVLEPGDYDFKVTKFERGISKNGNNMAELELEIKDGEKTAIVKDWIALTDKTMWKVANFFRSVGLKKHGEKTKMRWKESIGKTGRCTLTKVKLESKNGTPYDANQIHEYLDPIDETEDFEW